MVTLASGAEFALIASLSRAQDARGIGARIAPDKRGSTQAFVDGPGFDLDQIAAPERHDQGVAGWPMLGVGVVIVPRLVDGSAIGIADEIDGQLDDIAEVHPASG